MFRRNARLVCRLASALILLPGCQRAQTLIQTPRPVRLTRLARYEGQPDVSRDGKRLVFSAYGESGLDLFSRDLPDGEPRLLYAGPGDDMEPRWSPDGKSLAFTAREGSTDIWTLPAGKGEPKRLTVESGRDESPDWSPDGDRLVLVSDRGGRAELWVLTVLTGEAQSITSGSPPAANFSVSSPSWDRDRIVFSGEIDGNADLYSVSPGGGAWRRLTEGPESDLHPRVSADGRIAFVNDTTSYFNLYVLEPDGRRTTVTEERADIRESAWLPDARTLIYTRAGGTALLMTSPGGSTVDTVLDARGANHRPTFSPDGHELAFHASLEGQDDIWRVAVSEAGAGPVTSHRDDDREPDWSAAVNRICYTSVTDGNEDVWVMDPSGIEFRNVTRHPARDRSPRWSPDGLEILFVSDREGNDDIWIIAAGGGEARRLTDDSAPDLSPTMLRRQGEAPSWVVFQSWREGSGSLWKVSAAGGLAARITAPRKTGWDGSPAASPAMDGTIAYVRSTGNDRGIYTLNALGPGPSEPRRLVDDPAAWEDGPAWSPDGTRIAFESGGNVDLWRVEIPPPAGGDKAPR